MYTESIRLAILKIYLQPLEKLIERRAAWYLKLSERDQFAMSEEESRAHLRRMQEVADEIETLDNVSIAIADLAAVYHEKLCTAETALIRARYEHTQLLKNHACLQQAYQSVSEYQDLLHTIIQSRRTA